MIFKGKMFFGNAKHYCQAKTPSAFRFLFSHNQTTQKLLPLQSDCEKASDYGA